MTELRAIRAKRVITPGGARVDTIELSGETITRIGAWAEIGPGIDPQAVLTVPDLTLAPGLVDTHVHVTGSGRPTAPQDSQADSRENMLIRATSNAARALAEGVTTMRDVGARNDVIFPFKQAAEQRLFDSPTILAAGAPLTRTGSHGHWWGAEVDTADDIRRMVRRHAKAGANAIKVMVDAGVDIGKERPGLLLFDADDMALIVTEADRWRLPVAAHTLTTAGIRASIKGGVHSLEHAIFYDVKSGTATFDPELADEAKDKGIYVDPGPAFAYEVFADPNATTTWPRQAKLYSQRLDHDRLMRERGLVLVAGTDAGWYATPFGRFHLCPWLMVGRMGMSAQEALDACTIVSARSLGLEGQIGSLEKGKRADIIGLAGDPTVDIGALADVRLTVAKGRLVFNRSGHKVGDKELPVGAVSSTSS